MSVTPESMQEILRAAGFRGELMPNEPLAPYTTWRIGGPAELLAAPRDREDLCLAVHWARSSGIPWRILGNGSNVLVSDEGVRGLVLRVRKSLSAIRQDGKRLYAEAGTMLAAVSRQAASLGLAGIEFVSGIPGTVGGAVLMNAGWHEHEIGNYIEEVEYLEEDGSLHVYDRDSCRFRYRGSRFRGRPGVVLAATMKLRRDEPAAIEGRIESYAASRKQSQPTDLPSCGSVFLKPEGDFAGRLIDQAGLKSKRVGDMQVSPKHANFFVNLGSGSSADVLALVEEVEREVQRKFGVRLKREFELWR